MRACLPACVTYTCIQTYVFILVSISHKMLAVVGIDKCCYLCFDEPFSGFGVIGVLCIRVYTYMIDYLSFVCVCVDF